MPLSTGDALGPYVIVAPAGAGGMGEVYKARDTRLNRTVAVKVIGAGFGDRAELRERFAAEGRAIAALSHPNICSLYDTGHQNGRDFLVLEYLEGETLADRLRRGPVPVRELLGLAIEIADALHYAHRMGVVHRDLKPENVLLTRQGRAKLLDFGLAKLRAAAPQHAGVQGLPTAPVEPTTAASTIVGTLNYIAPERLEGRQTDARSDVFAFGAVFYEMATGRKAFDAESQARLIALILTSDPPPIDATAGLPSDLQWLVQNCLVKDPDARWQSMGDVAKVLKVMARTGVRADPPRRWSVWIPVAALTSAAILLGVALLLPLRRSEGGFITGRERLVSLELSPPLGSAFALTPGSISTPQFALAPDGHAIVFVAMAGADAQLWVRELESNEARAIPGTKGASYPFWSPDSRWVAFFADRRLKKVGFDQRTPRDICAAPNGRGGAWSPDGATLVFAPATASGLVRVKADGGTPAPLTHLKPSHQDHRWPQFLPDGRVLFFARSLDVSVQGLYVVSGEKPSELHFLRATDSSGLFASGWLLFADNTDLMVQRLDVGTLRLAGETIPLGFKVTASSAHQSAMSVSSEGSLATWSSQALSELRWYDRRGTPGDTAVPPGQYIDFRLSPVDKLLAVSRVEPSTNHADLAIVDLETGVETPLSPSPRTEASPVWSSDGSQLVFRSNRDGATHDLYTVPTHGGPDRRIHFSGAAYPTSWLDDIIMFHTDTQHDIWALDSTGNEQAVVNTSATEVQGQLAPGGRLAYTSSDASGTLNVYVRALDGKTGATRVSVDGGFDPRWRGDGAELFFIGTDGHIHVVEVLGDPLRPRAERKLFRPGAHLTTSAPYLSNFDVTQDGERFLIKVPVQPSSPAPITVTMHWSKARQLN